MALYVKTNVSSLNAQRHLTKSSNALENSAKRLASGLRINSARDDAAGLQISDRLTSQINGLNQGNRNAQDGISFCQTAEGAMEEMTNMYQRIRTLAIQAANGTNSASDRSALQQEVTELCKEITRIGEATTFGGIHLFDKTLTEPVAFQVGADANQTVSVDLSSGFRLDDVFQKLCADADPQERNVLLSGGVARVIDCSQSGSPPAVTVSADLDAPRGEYTVEVKSISSCTAMSRLIPYRVKDEEGIYIEGEEVTYGAGTITFTYGSEAQPRSVTVQVNEGDTFNDIIASFDSVTREHGDKLYSRTSGFGDLFSYDMQGCFYLMISTGFGSEYNQPVTISTAGDESLRIFDCNDSIMSNADGYGWRLTSLGADTVLEIDGDSFVSSTTNIFYDAARGLTISPKRVSGPFTLTVDPETLFNVDTDEHAQSAIAIADRFIAAVDSKRAELGAVQNRLESAIRNQANVAENASAARSRIRDTDFAAESASLAQQNILQETSKSVLASANHSTEFILSLLQQ